MYNVSDAVEMGSAHELILTFIKQVLVLDDSQENTDRAEEYFDE